MYKELNSIDFPKTTGINVNMMPIIMNEEKSIPDYLKQYMSLINQCHFKTGSTVYLTVHESEVKAGETQRRPGIHTEATKMSCWGGGGNWGGCDGMYMASNDGQCRLWNCQIDEVDNHGAIALELGEGIQMKPSTLYWMTDKTPHEALPSVKDGMRQFFRLVSEDVGVWWAKHNTPNPLGVLPKALIVNKDKFQI